MTRIRSVEYMARIGFAPVQRGEPALRFGSLDGRFLPWLPVCETQRAERSQSGGLWLPVAGRGVAVSGFWTGRLRREGSRDELACPARGQTNFGGQRMTRPQRRPASLRAFPELGLVMRWPGNRLSRRFSRSVAQWSGREASRPALGAVPPLLCASAARWGCARSRGRPAAERSGT